MPNIWVWDLYPLSPCRSANRTVDGEIPKGGTLSIHVRDNPRVLDFAGRVCSTVPIYREFYRPTDRIMEVLESTIADDDPENPSWDDIEAKLVAAGHDSSKLRSEKAPTLVLLLKNLKTVDVAPAQETELASNLPATQSQGGTESKDHVVDVIHGDDPTEPDATGYVASPSDLSSYVPMATIRADYCEDVALTSIKEITKVLEDFPANSVRWTRPPCKKTDTPHRQRRSVHLVDWQNYVKRLKDRRDSTAEGGFPDLSQSEIEARKTNVRRNRKVGK